MGVLWYWWKCWEVEAMEDVLGGWVNDGGDERWVE